MKSVSDKYCMSSIIWGIDSIDTLYNAHIDDVTAEATL